MNQIRNVIRAAVHGASLSGAALVLAACATDTVVDPGTASARAELTNLQSDPKLAGNAPVAMHDAEMAVRDAELPQTQAAVAAHLAYVAERRVQIAGVLARTKYDEDQRKLLSDQNRQIQLDARTNEADSAKRKSVDLQAQNDATASRNNDLQAQLAALQAKQTDRGMVLTLGDVLFSSGRSNLKSGSIANLDRLVSFLEQAPDRSVEIEGYTDNRGGADLNLALSQKRAESVATYLTGRGVSGNRITSIGNGYSSPVADNSTDAGRQANRRVEVIIQNP